MPVITRVSKDESDSYSWTDRDVAKFFANSPQAVKGWRKRRVGPPFAKLASGLIRYKQSDVVRWADSQKEPV